METTLTSKLVDIKIYEKSTGDLVLTQICPSSVVSKIFNEWVYNNIGKLHRAVVSSTEVASSNISSTDILNVPHATDFSFPKN
jgi:hypothetical protein